VSRMTRIAACQLPDVRGDIRTSLTWIQRCAAQAADGNVDLVIFPEAFLQGYFTEVDAVRHLALDTDSKAFADVLRQLRDLPSMLVVGMLEREGARLFNSALVIERGRMVGIYRKTHLVGTEVATFAAGRGYPVFRIGDVRFGINICYDTTFPEAAAAVAGAGAHLIVCPANNMLRRQTAEQWKHLHNEVRLQRVRETGLSLISADVVGASDTSIGYGPTAVLHPRHGVLAQVPLLELGMVVVDIDSGVVGSASTQPLSLASGTESGMNRDGSG
jgi:predicted amidohydrolase